MNIYYKINKILNYKNYSVRNKIDALLKISEKINCNLESNSTKLELQNAIKNTKTIYKAIKKLDKNTGERFLKLMDQ
tara:strand:+ start:889 stop:1119 length:231 start_codon:yes stop_codon:yes gene_type:complete